MHLKIVEDCGKKLVVGFNSSNYLPSGPGTKVLIDSDVIGDQFTIEEGKIGGKQALVAVFETSKGEKRIGLVQFVDNRPVVDTSRFGAKIG